MSTFLRLPEVKRITGLGVTSIYTLADFPKPIKLTARASAWDSDEIDAWMEARRQDRDKAA